MASALVPDTGKFVLEKALPYREALTPEPLDNAEVLRLALVVVAV